MTHHWQLWVLAAVLAVAIVSIALRLRALAPSGALAAVLLGTTVVGTGGWWAGVILVAFFASSSLLSQIQRDATMHQARGSRRDWVQVLANGWGLLVGTVLYAITGWQPWLVFGFGAIAAATADTWSSEIGRTSVSPPRLVTTWQRVPRGTSGAVSLRGLVASAAGALFIAVLAALALTRGDFGTESHVMATIIGLTLAGFLGSMADSVLGATIQEQRYCDSCSQQTESNPHSCGTGTRHMTGVAGLNNDVVNILCVLTGALIGMISGIL